MNIEFSVKEENGVVKIKITSPDKPVVIEMGAKQPYKKKRLLPPKEPPIWMSLQTQKLLPLLPNWPP